MPQGRAGLPKLMLAVIAAISLAGCVADRVAPGEGWSHRQCCGGELWQYQE
jgi:hypothetical protein